MKQLRNKKTGDISTNPLISVAPFTGGVRGCHIKTYRSAAEFNEEWEDVEDINVLSMPLIDNEEIREIVRAWADVNDAGKLKYNDDENSLDDIYRNTITFNRGLGLEDGHSYTITELCGEEKE